ncbi:MAG: glycosyltransferase family 2 protein [Nitrososphaeria archaeon]|nr:glycosyltransferase family 2 protein [Nitrososphaeria archaeon]NDB89054.1 glycosyltransferase family 2 protein [Nitrososphaerota archaeon]NDF27505.1 glycosyltransferase family 2 protein [Nitrosopumilaceae archaeon]NDB47100.1 glycosyltransferase family 2 protein [Nitrososphaeria archaeon]NDB90794.1 glycosyltransferase family 2 protein [Nitrososphaerota archaeon]
MDIVIGIPAYNEEEKIASIILKLKKITDKIIVCNDGSSDMTGQIARSLGAIVIEHPKNIGYGAGIRSIFLKAKEIQADILVTFDADGQHRTEDIQAVIDPILGDKADIVIGSRFLEKNEQMPEYRKLGIKVITKITNASMNDSLTDSQSGFRAYSKKVLNDIVPSDYGMGVSTEILIKASKKEFRIAEVPIVVSYEGKTSTHHPVSHGVSVILSTIKYTSIEHPLKFYGIPALVFLIVGLSFVLWTIQNYADDGKIITNIALIGVGTTVLGVILLIAAILLYSLINVVRESNTK